MAEARQQRGRLIGDIYDAAVDPDGWLRLPQVLMQVADGGSAVVGVINASGAVDAVTHGLPEHALTRYVAYYHSVNPMYRAVISEGPRLVAQRSFDSVSDLEFRQTEFYCDFARGLDTFQFIGGVFPVAPGVIGELGIHRGERNQRYRRRDLQRVQRVLPHLQRALQLRQRLGVLHQAKAGFAGLEALAIGCVICAPTGNIVFANAAAEAALADGGILGVTRHGLEAQRGAERQLAMLVAETALGGAGGAVRLTGRNGARLFALVSPLPAFLGGDPGHVLITLRSATANPTFGAATLHRLFGLTPAEARLALALTAGRSLAQIGAEHRVTENTLRTQLASVLRKTETSNQRELVRTLSLVPPLQEAPNREPKE